MRITRTETLGIELGPDIATFTTYPKASPEYPDQLTFEDEIPSAKVSADSMANSESVQSAAGRVASAVVITPQSPRDQRLEISSTSTRNKHLMALDEHLSGANSRESLADRIEAGFAEGDVKSLRKTAEGLKRDAKQELLQACGNCALAANCQIVRSFPKWNRVHEKASGKVRASQENRVKWRRRLLKDPDAHCLPPKKR